MPWQLYKCLKYFGVWHALSLMCISRQFITLSQLGKLVILCPHFWEVVGCSPVKDETVSPVLCHQRGVNGMSPLSHSAKVVSPLGSRLLTITSEVSVICIVYYCIAEV